MKTIHYKFLFVLFLVATIFACNDEKSQNVIIIQTKDKMFAVGEPPVIFKSYGVVLDYFSPGAIMVCRVNYRVLKQEAQAGQVYRINKDSKLIKLESFDTSLTNIQLAEKYLYTKDRVDQEITLEEVDLK